MSDLDFLAISESSPPTLFQHNLTLSQALLVERHIDFESIAQFLEPLLQAAQRCRSTPFFIQAFSAGRTRFLATNLLENYITDIPSIAPCWLLGRSSTCAITARHRSVSRRHAVITYYAADGFYIADVGSRNGTWINQQRLEVGERRLLQDGDLLQLGQLQIEFFLAARKRLSYRIDDTTS